MKKTAAFLLTLIGAFVFALAGCANGDTFTKKTYTADGAGIEKVTIQAEDREIEVYPSDDGQIRIDYFDGEKEYLEIAVTEEKELTVTLTYNKEWTDFIGTKPSAEYRKIRIGLPDSLLSSLSASTTNESITVRSLSFSESVSLASNGGSVICERVNAGKPLSLTAKDGDISGSVVGDWDDYSISCTIKKGESNLPESKEGGEKSLTVDCNNGDVNIEFVK